MRQIHLNFCTDHEAGLTFQLKFTSDILKVLQKCKNGTELESIRK